VDANDALRNPAPFQFETDTGTFSAKPAVLPYRFRYTGNRKIDEAPAAIRGRFCL
jgi:hypothetical protein